MTLKLRQLKVETRSFLSIATLIIFKRGNYGSAESMRCLRDGILGHVLDRLFAFKQVRQSHNG